MATTNNNLQREMLVCGKHEAVPALPGTKKGKSVRPPRAFIPGEKHERCLCDYTEFPELLQERLDFRAQEVSLSEVFSWFKEFGVLTRPTGEATEHKQAFSLDGSPSGTESADLRIRALSSRRYRVLS